MAPCNLLPVLQGLLHDTAVGDLGWTVGYEASEAIKAIRGEPAWVDEGPARLEHRYVTFASGVAAAR